MKDVKDVSPAPDDGLGEVMAPRDAFRIALPNFEGPLDLLLHLIREHKIDILDIPIALITEKYLEHLERMREIDLDIAGEFLVMASTLMYIKSRELLPVDQQVQVEGEEDGDDPRWELIRQLVEYKKFKDAAAQLQTLEARQEGVFPRLPIKPQFEEEKVVKQDISVFDLLNAVNAVLKRFEKRDNPREIYEDKWTVSEKISQLVKLAAERTVMKFSDLFADVTSRAEVVVTFLALLELIRLKQLTAVQGEAFGEIEICRATVSEASPSPAAAAMGPPAAPSEPTEETQSLST